MQSKTLHIFLLLQLCSCLTCTQCDVCCISSVLHTGNECAHLTCFQKKSLKKVRSKAVCEGGGAASELVIVEKEAAY